METNSENFEFGLNVHVSNMCSSGGKIVPNQFVIEIDDMLIFQSYSTIIALMKEGKIYLDKKNWDYSGTTIKYLGLLLEMNKQEILKAIKNKEFELVDLNRR